MFFKFERNEKITSVQWIAENRIAIQEDDGLIFICQIDESIYQRNRMTTIIKGFNHGYVSTHRDLKVVKKDYKFSKLLFFGG